MRPPTRPLSFLALLAVPLVATAQVDEPAPLVVMNLAAHPDDEDGLTLAYYRHAKDAVAYSVIFTRGEGGQNEAGPELYERLGAIRTRETEAAARILGTQVYYLNFYDFGFSKHAAEAFREWSRPRHGFWDTDVPPVSEEAGRDSVTARLVYLIRLLKPDVLFTNHDTLTAWPNAQHGHHQAVGLAAWEAFEKAADPSYHPEQLREEGVDLWQPSRLFVRQFRRGDAPDGAVPVSDPLPPDRLPQAAPTYADLAVHAASQHVSQGFDRFAERFRRDTTYFALYRSGPGTPPLPKGAPDLAAGLAPNPHTADAPLSYLLDSGRLGFPRAPLYVNVLDTEGVSYVAGNHLVTVPGRELLLSVCRAGTRCDESVGSVEIAVSGALDTVLVATGNPTHVHLRLPADLPVMAPLHRTQYDRFTNHLPLLYRIGQSAHYLEAFPLPPIMVDLAPAPIRLTMGENTIPVQVQTHDPAIERVRVSLDLAPAGGRAGAIVSDSVTLSPRDTTVALHLRLDAGTPPGPYRVTVTAEAEPTSAPTAPYTEWRPADRLDDVRVAEGLRVGFVRSYDRTTEDALRAMGADVVLLDSTALAEGAFDGLHTVVLDIRAYLVRPDLRAHNDRLLDWVRRGGHLVVGYHKTFEWNPGESGGDFAAQGLVVPGEGFAPYPLRLGRERVTYEDAPVEVLTPEHPLFHVPHAITAADWDGWVQERGLYFPSEYDARYREFVAMGDPGEAPLRGGLLLAEVGEGSYLYTPLVFYRQLEALNRGAWRLFANLVSLPLVRGEE